MSELKREVVMSRFIGGKRRKTVILGTGVVALAFGVTSALAGGGVQQKSKFFANSIHGGAPGTYCDAVGGPHGGPKKHAVGKVRIDSSKGKWSGLAVFHGLPKGDYHLYVFGSDCEFLGTVDEFDVKDGGPQNVPIGGVAFGFQTFFLDAHNDNTGADNSTEYMKFSNNNP
jgi:hypothetical protein